MAGFHRLQPGLSQRQGQTRPATAECREGLRAAHCQARIVPWTIAGTKPGPRDFASRFAADGSGPSRYLSILSCN
jgi:hypothetical protein